MTPTLSLSEREKKLAEIETRMVEIESLPMRGLFEECEMFKFIRELLSLARQPLPFHTKEETPKPDDICILICGRKNRYVEIGGIKRGMYETADGYQLAWDEVHGYILRTDLLALFHQFLNQQREKTNAD